MTMRKIISLVSLVIISVILVGCSPRFAYSGASEESQETGRQVVEIVDDFLDSRITAETAHSLISVLEVIYESSSMSDPNAQIWADVFMIEVLILGRDVEMELLLESRNRLAEGLGLDSR